MASLPVEAFVGKCAGGVGRPPVDQWHVEEAVAGTQPMAAVVAN